MHWKEKESNNMLRLIFGLFLTIISFQLKAHDIHSSVLEVEWNEDSTRLECAVRVFTDDLETASSDKVGYPVKLFQDSTDQRDTSAVYVYIKSQIRLTGAANRYWFLGLEEVKMATCIYFEIEIEPLRDTGKYFLINNILLDWFKDQQNIIHIGNGDDRRSDLIEEKDVKVKI